MNPKADLIPGQITNLLAAWETGDEEARDALFPLVYDQLHSLARRQGYRQGETLRPTALVHEVYLRLAEKETITATDRHHFFALAATAMRQITIDLARRRLAAKRGGGAVVVELKDSDTQILATPEVMIALNEAIRDLGEIEPRLIKIVELRFFGGLSVEETAEVLGVSTRTVKRDWRKARAFLQASLEN